MTGRYPQTYPGAHGRATVRVAILPTTPSPLHDPPLATCKRLQVPRSLEPDDPCRSVPGALAHEGDRQHVGPFGFLHRLFLDPEPPLLRSHVHAADVLRLLD